MKNLVARFRNDESGATAIEYGLIAAIIGVGIIVTVNLVSDGLDTTFTTVSTELGTQNG
ncbi:MAG: Flp family type IVb pilin [Pseudomonadota bacterium]